MQPMASSSSLSPPTPPHSFPNQQHKSLPLKRLFCPSPSSSHPPTLFCRSSSDSPRWDSAIQHAFSSAFERFQSYFNSPSLETTTTSSSADVTDSDWDWERWKSHFDRVDEQERLLSVLKAQVGSAVDREDYAEAARLKVAIAAAATNDTVGTVMSSFTRAVAEERYHDAAFFRDNAGAGLVGWWAGVSEDKDDPYGVIIRVTAEHGRYVARSYSPRQLSTATGGVPLFEIFLTVDKKGEYKQQAVYLKRGVLEDSTSLSSKAPDSTEEKDDLVNSGEDTDDDDTDDGSDITEGVSGFQNILRDMIPGVRVRVLKVITPEKDRDFVSKVFDQILDEEEDDDKDLDVENMESEDEDKSESDLDRNEIELDAGRGIFEMEERKEIAVKVVIGGLVQKFSGSLPGKELIRVPAKVEKKGRFSFSFSIEKDSKLQDSGAKELTSLDKNAKARGRRSIDSVAFDLARFIGKEKIPLKLLKDVGELISLSISQAHNRQPLSGSTTFRRIETVPSSDPLNGLYIGAHGLYTSEVIQLHRKFGQWQDDGRDRNRKPSSLEFYEYVEAIKVTGDPYVPAGKVAFRARIGKSYQLPHKGLIPEEFGVVARYKGQGRLAEPGFRNPRWVDGELVILDGKYIKGGPVVGFVYWAPEYHFLVFFNRLRLQ